MQYAFCAALLAAATLDVAMAHPSAHQGHQRLHVRSAEPEAKAQDWNDPANYKGVNWNAIDYSGGSQSKPKPAAPQYNAGSKPAPQPEKQAAPKPQPYKAPAEDKGSTKPKTPSYGSGSTGGGSSPSKGKCAPGSGGWGSCPKEAMKPSIAGYESRGNTGVAPGNPNCGCNIQTLCHGASTSGYDYTNTFKSTASSPRKIVIWNTVGCSSGSPLSGKTATEGGTTEFTLHPGDQQVVVFQKGSKVNWCDYTEGKTNSDDGSRQCVYGEAEFGFKDGWSAYDVSKLRAGGVGCGMSIEAPGQKTSDCHQNCYNLGQEAVTNIAPVLGPGPVHLTTTVGNPA